jgi:hypothetical protein
MFLTHLAVAQQGQGVPVPPSDTTKRATGLTFGESDALRRIDALENHGEDLREHPTLERKRILKDLVRNQPRILYARHVLAHGIDLFRLVCEQDLEGMVCKRRNAAYVTRADCKPPVS